jgi:hypothetical protein
LRAAGTLLRRVGKVKLQPDLLQISGVHLPEYFLNGDDDAPQNFERSYDKVTPST